MSELIPHRFSTQSIKPSIGAWVASVLAAFIFLCLISWVQASETAEPEFTYPSACGVYVTCGDVAVK